jgi:RNA polymerase sigma-70 factor (ECF subfamily)
MASIERRQSTADFEATVLPHLNAAHNLARWLLRDENDAKDVVQDAYLRAFRFFDSFRGGDSRGWLLTIVRNACYDWLRKARPDELRVSFDEESHGREGSGSSPEVDLLRRANAQSLKGALERLPVGLREAIVLRELEGLSYAEIAAVADIPIGTVMSRLSRSRKRLQESLRVCEGKEVKP